MGLVPVWPHALLGRSLPISAVLGLCGGLPLLHPPWAHMQPEPAYNRHPAHLAPAKTPVPSSQKGPSPPLPLVFFLSSPISPSHPSLPT